MASSSFSTIFLADKSSPPRRRSSEKANATGGGFVSKTGKIFCARTPAFSPPLLLLLLLLLYLFGPRSNLLTSRLRLGTILSASANQTQCYGHVVLSRPMRTQLAE